MLYARFKPKGVAFFSLSLPLSLYIKMRFVQTQTTQKFRMPTDITISISLIPTPWRPNERYGQIIRQKKIIVKSDKIVKPAVGLYSVPLI